MAEDLVLKIKDLVVHYETDERMFDAVNGLTLRFGKSTLWVW